MSNCNDAPSRRNDLVQKLKTFVDVDVYGTCGDLKLPDSENSENFLDKSYKFYFAFENTLCDDYLSEKTYKILNTNMIPVIYSAADISRFLPDKSYIDVSSFATADDLGKYLKFLSENPQEFVKYFWWRDHYKTNSFSYYPSMDQICQVCVKLNEPTLLNKRQSYVDIKKWYSDSCSKPRIQLRF